MAQIEDYRQAGQSIYDRLHLASYPVAIKYIRNHEEIPEGFLRPSLLGQKASLCQAFTYARRLGFALAMTSDDNFCAPATVMHGWEDIPFAVLMESQLHQKWHRDAKAEQKRLEHGKSMIGEANLSGLSQYAGFICCPLHDTKFEPDTVLIFGNGENVTHIIHALTYDGENFPTSSFEGFAESCLKGGLIPFVTGVPQVVIPGMGDRAFSGVYDYEIAIGVPGKLVFAVSNNLFLTGGQLNIGQPVKTLLPQSLTENITPGFQFLREKIIEHKKKTST